jgi:hypothetical protein
MTCAEMVKMLELMTALCTLYEKQNGVDIEAFTRDIREELRLWGKRRFGGHDRGRRRFRGPYLNRRNNRRS